MKNLMRLLFTVPAAPSLRGAGKCGARGLTHATRRGRRGYGVVLAVALGAMATGAALWRTGALAAPVGEDAGGTEEVGGTVWGVVDEPVVAEKTTVTLSDDNPPQGKAFYRVVVSVP